MNTKELDYLEPFCTYVVGLVYQIRSHGETIEETIIVGKVLRVFRAKFDHLVVSIEETKDLT